MSEKIYGQFDLETIEKLADIVKNKDLGEITIADGDKVITVKGKKCPPPAPMGMPMPMAVGTASPAAQTAPNMINYDLTQIKALFFDVSRQLKPLSWEHSMPLRHLIQSRS